jgi:hypothetical protein
VNENVAADFGRVDESVTLVRSEEFDGAGHAISSGSLNLCGKKKTARGSLNLFPK